MCHFGRARKRQRRTVPHDHVEGGLGSGARLDSRLERWKKVPMIANQRICVVLPAYNAGRTLEATVKEIPTEVVDDVILVDDASSDDTLAVARRLGIFTVAHARNKGYGA